MRIAAETIEEFNNTYRWGLPPSNDAPWRPSELRNEARHVEDKEQEATELEMLVEQLADDLCAVLSHTSFEPIAHWLIENGWRKDI